MLNFLITNVCALLQTDYFKYIVQFDDTLQADIWFIENGFNTDQMPFYKQEFECAPMDERTARVIVSFAENNDIDKFTLIESEDYRVLCLTQKERELFTIERLEGCSEKEKLEFTDVDTSFVFGFV